MQPNSGTDKSINALTCIRSGYPTLAASETRVSDWIMQQSEKMMYLPMERVAQACEVRDATVLGFYFNVGFLGYTVIPLKPAVYRRGHRERRKDQYFRKC